MGGLAATPSSQAPGGPRRAALQFARRAGWPRRGALPQRATHWRQSGHGVLRRHPAACALAARTWRPPATRATRNRRHPGRCPATSPPGRPQRPQHLRPDRPERPVRHRHHHVPRPGPDRDVGDDLVHRPPRRGRHPARGDLGGEPVHVEPLRLRHPVGRRRPEQPHLRRGPEAACVLLLVQVAARRVRPGLEGHQQPRPRVRPLDGGQRPVHRGGVVGEVVDHRHAALDAADLLAPLHSPEGLEPGRDLLEGQAEPRRRRGHPERILHVVRPAHGEPHRPEVPAAAHEPEPGPVRAQREPASLPVGRPLHRVGLDRAPGPAGDSHHALPGGAGGQEAVLRHQVHEALEGALVVRLVPVDVGVVQLARGEDRRARPVVQELGPLVEVGRVVLVPLDHEGLAPAQPEVGVEVAGDAAHQERRIPPGVVEQEAHHRAGGGLPVRAHHHHPVARPDEELAQRLREGHVGQAALPHRRRLRIHRPNDVAHHHHVGPGPVEVLRPVALHDLDAPALELRGHGRVDVLVRPGHLVARRPEHPGEGAHPGSGHADEVDPADLLPVDHPGHPAAFATAS